MRKLILLLLVGLLSQYLLSQSFTYYTLLDTTKETLVCNFSFAISHPEIKYEKSNDSKGYYNYNFYVSYYIYTAGRNSQLIADTTLHYQYSLENWDVEFYANWAYRLLPGKYKVRISVEDLIAGKTNIYDYTVDVVSPLKRLAGKFVGSVIVPFVYISGEIYPIMNNLLNSGAEQLVLLVYVYYFPDKVDTAVFSYSIVAAGVPIARDTFSVYEMRAFLLKVPLVDINAGTITIYLSCQDYIDSLAIDYIYKTEKALRVIRALKFVTSDRTYKKFFKNVSKTNAVELLLKFYAEGKQAVPHTFELMFREFLARFEYAEKFFVENTRRGFETDRGYILIVYGFPDYIETFRAMEYYIPNDLMVWYYEREGFKIIFEKIGVGDEWRVRPFVPPGTFSWRILKFDF